MPKKAKSVAEDGGAKKYVLRLYVTGSTSRSEQAIRNIRKICQDELEDHYDLEIVDIYQQPELASKDQILAAPTLIRKLPLPLRKLVGDLSDKERVIAGLQIVPKKK
ncbi:MAG TPA: circadian clock KaiB family protein [Methanomassiliicoccales archaeon]|nr:circadian clock KaiB family protein [Methanomassiliicoccales archaeon]